MKTTAPAPTTLAVTLGLAASLGLAGCAADQAAPGTSTHSSNHGSPAASVPGSAAGSAAESSAAGSGASSEHNDADVLFAQMMIPHHAQAVEMSDILLAKTGLPTEVTDLATRIKAAQAPELRTMTSWLEAWDQPATASGHAGHAGHGMAGMLGEKGIDELKAAQGTEAARLFLEQMIGHHEGAVEMAEQEITGGRNSEAIRLARAIVTAQEAEISEMRGLLAAL